MEFVIFLVLIPIVLLVLWGSLAVVLSIFLFQGYRLMERDEAQELAYPSRVEED